MTKHNYALMGSALAALLCTAGLAKAQDYYGPYERVYDNGTETVIVHPDYDDVEKRQLVGRINGEVNPTEYSISPPREFLRSGSHQRRRLSGTERPRPRNGARALRHIG